MELVLDWGLDLRPVVIGIRTDIELVELDSGLAGLDLGFLLRRLCHDLLIK